MEVVLFSPRMGVSYTGRLVSVDAARQSFVVQVDDTAVFTYQSALAQATLCIGGAPRQLTVQVQPIDSQRVRLIPLSPAKVAERRARRRYSVQLDAQLQLGTATLGVKVVNISASGVGMQASVAMERGSRGTLSITLLGLDTPIIAVIEARRCRPRSNGEYYIGAAFAEISRTDALWLRKLFP
jgi:hypothetical protein